MPLMFDWTIPTWMGWYGLVMLIMVVAIAAGISTMEFFDSHHDWVDRHFGDHEQ